MPPALRGNKRDQRVGNPAHSGGIPGEETRASRLRAEGSFHLASKPVLLVAIAGVEKWKGTNRDMSVHTRDRGPCPSWGDRGGRRGSRARWTFASAPNSGSAARATWWLFREVQHEAWFREDTEMIDFFAPPRDDFLLGGKPAYMSEG